MTTEFLCAWFLNGIFISPPYSHTLAVLLCRTYLFKLLSHYLNWKGRPLAFDKVINVTNDTLSNSG